MDRRQFFTAGAAACLAPHLMRGAAWAQDFDYAAIERIREMGLNERSSQVMQTASYMMDVLGPRLSASPQIRRSGEWVVEKMNEWGLSGAALEPWPEDPTGGNNGFPRGWENEKFYLHAVEPLTFPISGMSIAWTPGTEGLVRGECVLAPETEEDAVRGAHAGKLRGKWVLAQDPLDVRAQWDPVARRYTDEQLDNLETPDRGPEFGSRMTPQAPRAPGVPFDRYAFFKQEGALGVLVTNKGQGVVNVLHNSRIQDPADQLPRIAVIAEHYGRIARSLQNGQPVTLEADIRNTWRPMPEMFNVVGEIPGSEAPDEVVILGGHFDSFHAATGATDNGGACSSILEALRVLKATNAPLKRTVRVCLWNGEEQGLIGSRLYVANHFGGQRGAPTAQFARGETLPRTEAHAKFQAYFNLDNGAGAIRGVHGQGNRAIMPIFRSWMEPFRDIGATHVSARNTGSTDHTSFDAAGLPGFQFIQDPIDYEPKTHHTNMDFYESLQPEDMRRNSVILAGFAMLAANHPDRLPRKG